MDKWQHLFVDGEYAAREKILSGLILEQVTFLPSRISHSIYDKLWHLSKWQHIIALRDEALYETWVRGGRYPTRLPASEQDWHDLVERFLAGLEQVLVWTTSPDKLKFKIVPGITMTDNLHSLAIHNAYHFGKIMAIRQMLGAW